MEGLKIALHWNTVRRYQWINGPLYECYLIEMAQAHEDEEEITADVFHEMI